MSSDHETPSNHTESSSTSEKKAASNRHNAEKSTGPRTEQGKANSRLNALKHGVLASQGVITTIEGREPRGEFEAMVDGLAEDFQPVGTYEQLLVQEIAACFWRKRRLLRFESRAAFESRDRRTLERMQPSSIQALQPRYLVNGENFDAEDILAKAGLGLDLPNERDSLRVVRYEGSISRTLRNTLAQLKTQQALRCASRGGDNSSAYADRELVVDSNAMKINAGPEHKHLGAKTSLFSHGIERQRYEEEEAADAEEEAAEAAAAAQTSQNNQTKPNSPTNTEIQPPREDRPAGAKPSSKEDPGAQGGTPPSSK